MQAFKLSLVFVLALWIGCGTNKDEPPTVQEVEDACSNSVKLIFDEATGNELDGLSEPAAEAKKVELAKAFADRIEEAMFKCRNHFRRATKVQLACVARAHTVRAVRGCTQAGGDKPNR